jgi:hypothetical protein
MSVPPYPNQAAQATGRIISRARGPSLKTLKAPADLIKFLGSLIDEIPENAEPPSGNEWCKEPM